MSQELKELLEYLLPKGYAIMVGDQPALTNKFYEVLQIHPLNVVTKQTVIVPVSLTKNEQTQDEKKDIWNKFCTQCDIPFRVTATDGRTYTVRQYSAGIATRLIKIINTPGIDYNRLVESTKNYYKTVTYKSLLSNYFEKEIWRGEYDNWSKAKITQTDRGWED